MKSKDYAHRRCLNCQADPCEVQVRDGEMTCLECGSILISVERIFEPVEMK